MQNLSTELLDRIFQVLDSSDLRQCQKACRAWYHSAHLNFLDQIHLNSNSSLEQFLASINHNPDPEYLRSVKTIELKCSADQVFERESIEELFTRFPSLKMVEISAGVQAFDVFDDSICDALLQNCPNVDVFEVTPVDTDPASFYEIMLKFKNVLTQLDFMKMENIFDSYDRALQFVYKFTHLRKLIGGRTYFTNFAEYLPVFQELPGVSSMFIQQMYDDDKGFMERHLSLKTQQEQDQLLERLAKIKRVVIHFYEEGPCTYSMKFITTYLTGLEFLSMGDEIDDMDWRPFDQHLISNTSMNLLYSAEDRLGRRIHFQGSTFTTLMPYIPNMFRAVTEIDNKLHKVTLKVVVGHLVPNDSTPSLFLIKLRFPFRQTMTAAVNDPVTALAILKRLVNLKGVDLYKFHDNQNSIALQTENYNDILEKFSQIYNK